LRSLFFRNIRRDMQILWIGFLLNLLSFWACEESDIITSKTNNWDSS
jgi:hypothetical protein